MTNYTLPANLNSASDAAEVLNRAPDVLAEIEENLYIASERVANASARVRLTNKAEKDQIIRAEIQLDEEVRKEKVEEKKWQTLKVRWEAANASAKIFYRSFNH